MRKDPLLSVVLPVYNESGAIVDVLEELVGILETSWPEQWEVIAVDDGSTDDTADQLQKVASVSPSVRCISLRKNVGQSGALWVGFQEAKAEWIATMDSDGQNDPADLVELWPERERADAVFGYRVVRQDVWSKRVGSRWANAFRNWVLKEDITDTGCALKLFRTSFARSLTPWNGMHRFLGSLFLMQGATIRQLPVHHRARSCGTSKYTNGGRLKKTIWDLFAVRWLRSRYVRVESIKS